MPEGGRATHVVRGIQPYRKLWHMSSVWAPLVYMHYVENRTAALEIAGGVLLFFFMIDLFRLTLPVGNDIAFRYFSAVIGDSERRNFNTSTYFVLGAFLTVLLFEKHIAVVALMFLSLGDPMGALIGSKYGSIKVFGKSLQGSLAVFLTCFIVGSFLIDPKLAFWGALCATMFELLSSKINDNVSIPLFSGLAMTLLTEKAELTDPLQVAFVVFDVYLVFVVVTSLVGQLFKHIITWRYRTDYAEMFAHREGWTPSVTVIKPLKGVSEGLKDDLASWFAQDYLGAVQIVFAVGSEADPAAALARELIAANPEADARLVVATPDERFPDRANNILAGLRVARGEAILMSDAPVRASRSQVREAVAPLGDDRVGLVTAAQIYCGAEELPAAMNAQVINTLATSVYYPTAFFEQLNTATSALLAIRRETLEKLGGYERFAAQIADHHALAQAAVKAGLRALLLPRPVRVTQKRLGWRAWLQATHRMNVTIRTYKPRYYPLFLFQCGFFHAAVAAAVHPGAAWAWALFFLSLTVDLASYLYETIAHAKEPPHATALLLYPVLLLLAPFAWASPYFGRVVHWKDQRMYIDRDGTAHRLSETPRAPG